MEKEKLQERQRLEKVTDKLNRDLDGVIVEGFSDRRVMEELGFKGKIFLSAERSTEDLVEDVARGTERVGVLTDFDSHGREEARKITHELEKEIDVVESARKEFGEALTYNDRYAVEEAAPLFEDRQEKFIDASLDRL